MALPPHLADLESRLLARFDDALQSYRRALDERLRAALESVATSADDVAPPQLGSLLGDLSGDALEQEPRRLGAREALTSLLGAVRSADRAARQADVLEALLEGCRSWCDRAALVLTRSDDVELWGSSGFEDEPATGRPTAWSDALRAALVRPGCRRLNPSETESLGSSLGLAARGECVVVPLILRDRLAAVLWADRASGTIETAALQLLVHLTAQRLELQALSERAATATLYDETDSGLEAPPLWAGVAAPVPAEPELEVPAAAPPAESGATAEEIWEPAPEPAPEIAAEAEPAAAVEVDLEPPAEESTLTAAPMPPVEPEVEEVPEFEMEEAPAAASEPPTDDSLGTVRMPIVPPQPLPASEPTAPLRIEAQTAEVVPPAASTHEIPVTRPAVEPPPLTTAPVEPPPARQPDPNEDATVLTMRRPEWATPPPPPPAMPPPAPLPDEGGDHAAPRPAARTTEVAPPPDVQGPGLAFAGMRSARTSDQPAHEEAKRLARLLISEIKLYNEEQVLEGRRNRDLYHRLREDIDRSRQIYEERVDAEVRADSDYFQQELIRSLAGGDPRALGI